MIKTLIIAASIAFSPDTVLVPAVLVSAKQPLPDVQRAGPVAVFRMEESDRMISPKSLSTQVPGLFLPDYGSSMTSTIYHRGFGSRMENPVIGVYVDRIPILDKNAYDIDFLDVDDLRFYGGAQGTLYGRNTMGGVLEVKTLSPSRFKGIRGRVEGGSGGVFSSRIAAYGTHRAVAAGFRHGDGWFTNLFDGHRCDPYDALQLRYKEERMLSDGIFLEGTLSASLSDEGGYAYGQYAGGHLRPPAYNDECGYRRMYLAGGVTLSGISDRWRWQATASVQGLLDRMRMDQDFTEASVFTLEQRQRMAGSTAEIVLRPAAPSGDWDHATGIFLLGKSNRMAAPVEFLPDGVRTLILDNANRNIPADVGYLSFDEDRFTIGSDFGIGTWNAALFHESILTRGRWILTAGVRLDYEGGRMRYLSQAGIHYRFIPIMKASKSFSMDYEGTEVQHHAVILPRLSALYRMTDRWNVYVSLAGGHRAGGFNTQIFSDILQNRMMNGLMDDLGVHFPGGSTFLDSRATRYRPEEALTLEAGTKFFRIGGFSGSLNLFWTECRNQQLTVFPPGKATGRMMTNAGRSRSLGAEADLRYEKGGLSLRSAAGWNRATFIEYDDGMGNYAGKRLPYAPSGTLFLSAAYRLQIDSGSLRSVEGALEGNGVGTIWWNESNTLSQPPYMTLGARLSLSFNRLTVYVRGENLTDLSYRTFYFKSMGNEFFAPGKPRRAVIGISFNIQSI